VSAPLAVIYLRVSTAEQASEGVGLDAQEARCRAVCAARGFEVTSVYRDEGVSGKADLASRPGLARAVAEVRAHVARGGDAALVAYSVSRVARSQRVLWGLVSPGGKAPALPLVSATEPFDTSTPMGRAMLGMIAVWSALEADLVSERTRDALAAVRASGKRLGAPPMMDRVPEVVARIVAMRAAGKTLHQICDELNAEGVAGARGGRWWPKNVRAALAQGAAAHPSPEPAK
jgi:DNA invertase Pin-like site-specific DNA recombinase